MKGIRYTVEFKAEAIQQISERGHGIVEVSKCLGISDSSRPKVAIQNHQHLVSETRKFDL